MHRTVKWLMDFYRKQRVKPFKKSLNGLYEWYIFRNRWKKVLHTAGGITYELDLNELIDSAIYYQGWFEPETAAAIDLLCSTGMIALDIGANVGCHTLRIARNVGPTGTVIAFEPMSWAFKKLGRNIELNNFENIRIEKLALSNKTEIRMEQFCSSWPLYPSSDMKLHPIHHGLVGEPEQIHFMTLDEYVQKEGIQKIDFIKIDVDGYEYNVIQGGNKTIKHNMPIMIIEMSEKTHRAVASNAYEMIEMLRELGYRFFSIPDMREIKLEQLFKSLHAGQEPNILVKTC